MRLAYILRCVKFDGHGSNRVAKEGSVIALMQRSAERMDRCKTGGGWSKTRQTRGHGLGGLSLGWSEACVLTATRCGRTVSGSDEGVREQDATRVWIWPRDLLELSSKEKLHPMQTTIHNSRLAEDVLMGSQRWGR